MDMQTYLMLYKAFDDEFFPKASLEEKENKMVEEMYELTNAMFDNDPLEDKISEALDVMNMSIKLLTAYGAKNLLDAGYRKLCETAEKYRSEIK